MALGTWVALILFILAAVGFFILSRWVRLRWMVALLLRLGLLALVAAAFFFGVGKVSVATTVPEILILDFSDSIPEQARFDAQVFATAWKEAGNNREVLVFGASSQVVLSDEWPEFASQGSDLDEALRQAAGLLGSRSGKVLVMTDGLVEDTLALRETLFEMQSAGVQFSFISMETQNIQNDLYLGDIQGSTTVWEGNQFSLQVPVYAPAEMTGKTASVQAWVNGADYTRPTEWILKEGENLLEIPFQAGSSGVMEIEVRVTAADDGFPGNNAVYTAVQVYAKPRVLFVTNAENEAAYVVQGLAAEGMTVEVVSPKQVPISVAGLDPYQAVVLHNILSQDLSLEQMQNIELHVLEKGRGLVMLGGRNSFTLGGYQNSILEPLIPVVMAPPDRVQRVPITFLLVLDRSGSMAGDRNSDIAPIDLTKEGALRAIETLRSDDYLGVMTFSGVPTWEVDVHPVGDGLALREAQDKISQIQAFGGTLMYNALEMAVNTLLETETTDYPHILLMSDGESGGSDDEFVRLVQEARRNGITISTIALGVESDSDRLALIAQEGGGRFYAVENAIDLPEVMISESRAIQAENVQEGETNIVLEIDGHPILSDIRLDTLPRLNAYIAVRSKASLGAEDVLVSGSFGDPILSVWQVGLGHVAAWMGDIGESWVPEMRSWGTQGQFWAQVVRYTLPSPTFGESYISVEEDETQLTFDLAFDREKVSGLSGQPIISLASVGGQLGSYRFSQTGVGKFSLVQEKPEIGAYSGVIQYNDNGEQRQLYVPFAVNYPAEWQFAGPAAASESFDTLLTLSGNRETTVENALVETFEETAKTNFDWYQLILILLVVSWPVEIAIRRWQMPWRRP